MNKKYHRRLTKAQNIAISFLLIILAGAFLLMLPISSKSGQWTDPLTALFTATSASCVTGLVVVDTYTHWSLFGQICILIMIEIGGLGVITMGTLVAMAFKRNITLKSRNLLQESVNSLQIGGVVRLIRMVIKGTIFLEAAGALVMMAYFIPLLGVGRGIYYSIFHAISAFCNAGFDLMGYQEEYISFVNQVDVPWINIPIMLLIVIGGIGFLVWEDICEKKWNIRKYNFHTKLVLTTTFILIFGGAALFYLFEHQRLFADFSPAGKVFASFFSAITPRTAGFNTVDLTKLSENSWLLTIILMFIGGSPGSTAGGIKTTTIAVVLIFMISNLRQKRGANVFGRCISDETVKKALTVFMLNLTLALTAAMILCGLQDFSVKDVFFEVFSAGATVGMTTGITRELCVAARLVIILLMYTGRVGSMTFALIFSEGRPEPKIKLPDVDVPIG